MTTNLTDKFNDQAAVLRGTRENDVVSALVGELPSPIGAAVEAAIVAGALAQNIANDLTASALAGNIGDEVATSALAENIASALDPRLALLPAINGAIGGIDGLLQDAIYPALQEIQSIINGNFAVTNAAIAALAECCAALGLAIEGLRDDVQAGNAATAAGLGKIGSNQESPPPAPPAPPPAPGGTNTYWVCGRFSPAWVYLGDNPTSGQAVWRAYSTAPAGISVGIVGADGWGPASTDGSGLYFDPGTYRFEQVGGTGGTIKTGGSTPIGDPLPRTVTYATTALQIDFLWEGSGSPSQASIAICRKRTLA